MTKTKIALLYGGELLHSIMLEDYARRNVFPRFRHFTGDGISGTRFDRPGFMAMMEEVKDGNVEAIIIKGLSRLGQIAK